MRYADFLEHMSAFDAVLHRRGFQRVDQAKPDHETDAPVVVYCLDLAQYARDYPRLAEGDLQIDTADIVVKLRENQLGVLIEGDELSDLAERFDVVVPGGGSDLEEQVRVAAHQLDQLLTAAHR